MLTDQIKEIFGLDSMLIENGLIKEEHADFFSVKLLHTFLDQTKLTQNVAAIHHNDHAFGFIVIYNSVQNQFLITGPYTRSRFHQEDDLLYQFMRLYHIPMVELASFYHYVSSLKNLSETQQRELAASLCASFTGSPITAKSIPLIELAPDANYARRFPEPEKASFINQQMLTLKDISANQRLEDLQCISFKSSA